jgi:methylmalonyl-CoA mutase N-terminal domain/subunit
MAHESGVTSFVDPLGGSYFVERLTQDMEAGARDYFQRIDDLGGMVAAIEQGYPQREIAESAYRFQREVEDGERTIVGVNRFTDENETGVQTLYLDEGTAKAQCARVAELRDTRDPAAVDGALDRLRHAALGPDNLMPPLLDAVRAYATVGEMCDALRDVWGEYEESASV